MDAVRKQLTYANVMATVAVFLALGGSAWALAKKSVGPKQLKKGAVITKKIKNQAVTSPKIASGAVTGTKIADGSVGIAKVGASLHLQCGAGTQYLQGACIQNGPQGTANWTNAQLSCQNQNARLPNPSELFTLAKRGVVFGAREWTDNISFDGTNLLATTVFSGGNFLQLEDTDNPIQFRCVFDTTG